MDARRAKMRHIRERGENPFANDFAKFGGPVHDIGDVRSNASDARQPDGKYDVAKVDAQGTRAHVAGRVIAFRSTGGLSFLRLRDRTGEIQLLLERSDARRRLRAARRHRRRRHRRGRRDRSPRRSAASSRSSRRACASSRRRSARCPRSGTASRTSRRATASATSISSRTRTVARRLPRAQPHRARARARSSTTRASSRSRRRRCTRSSAAPSRRPFDDAPQRARHAPLHAHRARALS